MAGLYRQAAPPEGACHGQIPPLASASEVKRGRDDRGSKGSRLRGFFKRIPFRPIAASSARTSLAPTFSPLRS